MSVLIEICDKLSGGYLGERHFNCRMTGRNFEEVASFLLKCGMVSCWITY